MKPTKLTTYLVFAVLMGLLLLVLASAPAAPNPNPTVLPPNSNPHGASYGDWGAKWWQWAFSTTLAENPVLDTTGEFAHVNQSGPVFFLAGTFGETGVVRDVTVSPGRTLFFPIANTLWLLDDPSQEEFAREAINAWLDTVDILECTVDGVALQDLGRYRAVSPLFTLVVEEGTILTDWGIPTGEYPSVCGGYWLMLTPLTPGNHVIYFRGGITGAFEVDVTYHLTVKGGGE